MSDKNLSPKDEGSLNIFVNDNITTLQVFSGTTADTVLKFALKHATTNWLLADSRNGPVARAPGLFITEYHPDFIPVLRSPLRDANPFFHLVEAFYYLAGRKDVALPSYFAKQLAAYSDDGDTLWGSYGFRWRNHFNVDQLDIIIDELRKDPTSRRCVIQMWDGYLDLNIATGTGGVAKGKDTPCNHAVTFDPKPDGSLNMTVSNRSNDLVWGAYGANMVHFNILHSYVSAAVGLSKGSHFQASSNTHVYLENPVVQRLIKLVDGKIELTEAYEKEDTLLVNTQEEISNYKNLFPINSLGEDSGSFVDTLNSAFDGFLESVAYDRGLDWKLFDCDVVCIRDVLLPAMDTYLEYKRKVRNPEKFLTGTQLSWNSACLEWLNRRKK